MMMSNRGKKSWMPAPSAMMMVVGVFLIVVCLSANHVAADCPNNCYDEWGQGECNATTDTCACESGFYTGEDCSVAFDPNVDWDNMACYNGGRFYPPFERSGWRRWCVCPPGWNGIDCSLCAVDSVCDQPNDPGICDKSIFMYRQKAINCSVTGSTTGTLFDYIKGQPAITANCQLPEDGSSTGGTCSMTMYFRDTGIPVLFSCNMTACARTIDSQDNQKIYCEDTYCNATSYGSAILREVLSQLSGYAEIICNDKTRECLFNQYVLVNILGGINLLCTGAAECLTHNSKPLIPTITPNYYKMFITLGGGIIAFIIAAIGGFGCYVAMRKYHKHYVPMPHVEATISFHNISCSAVRPGHPDKRLLHDISGNCLPGNVTAIIGSSGAGKTTFLDVLAGRKNTGVITGDIFVNGEPRTKAFKRLSGYVTQDDVFLGTLTVHEYLMYNAKLRLPPHMTHEQKEDKVREVLAELGISHIANSRIGTETSRGISGGERKRLAIAAELIVDPSILMLDEPTSGLDSYSASSLVSTLSNLAHGVKRRTIIMSIHQPRSDIYYKFDYLMVLAKGRLVYYGPSSDALSHFTTLGYVCPQNFNPADFIIDTVATVNFTNNLGSALPTFDDIAKTNNGSMKANSKALKGNAGALAVGGPADVDEYASPFFVQFQVLTQRTFVNVLRNPFLLKIQYSVSIIVALLLGYLYYHIPNDLQHGGLQNRMGALFFICALLSFSAITSIDLFFAERLLFLRERANGCYRTSAYFLAKAVSDIIPMRVIPPILVGSICYYMIGFNPDYVRFLYFIVTLVLVSTTATAMCFVISVCTPSVSVGNMVAILLLFFFLLFGGFLVNTNNMPGYVRWVTQLSFFTYGFTILMINEFLDIIININPDGYKPTPVSGRVILTQVGMNPEYFGLDIGLLCVILAVYMSAAYVLLRFYVKERR